MSKDMLGSVVRAAISVPQDRMDVLAKVASAMAADNPTGEAWHRCFKTQLKEGLSPPEPVLDFLVRVDRSVKPSYPDWFKKLENPELECSGPAIYLLSGVDQWLHDDQKRGDVGGDIVYRHLQEGDALATCLNLQDGLAIQKKGIAVFRKLFAGKAVFLWGSVVQYPDGRLLVPYLYDDGEEVGLRWHCWTTTGIPTAPLSASCSTLDLGTVVFLTLCPLSLHSRLGITTCVWMVQNNASFTHK